MTVAVHPDFSLHYTVLNKICNECWYQFYNGDFRCNHGYVLSFELTRYIYTNRNLISRLVDRHREFRETKYEYTKIKMHE